MPLMLAYIVRRITGEGDSPPRYHLFDEAADLLFIAEPVPSPSSTDAPPDRRILFRDPEGVVVASLNLPRATNRPGEPPQYALIHDDAVYALLSGAEPEEKQGPFRLCSIEVEGKRWLGLRPTGDGQPLLSLYEDVASDLSIYGDLEGADLPDPVGIVEAGTDEGVFVVQMARGKLIQPGLMALALVLLVNGRDV